MNDHGAAAAGWDRAGAVARIRRAYDLELFQQSGQGLIEQLTGHLRRCGESAGRVLNWSDPRQLTAEAARELKGALPQVASAAALAERFGQLVELALARGINLHDPRYVGHQVPATVPLAGLWDGLGAVINNPMAIYEMGPFVTAAEHAVTAELLRRVGWGPTAAAVAETASPTASPGAAAVAGGGIVTHGASLANLTAMLVARNVALGGSWQRGLLAECLAAGGKPAKLVVQADAHYCLARSAGILGLGTEQVVPAAVDDRRRMCPQRLDETLWALRREGNPIVAVAASACATPIGAFDPLEEIAEVCERHDVWLHVDAAHGGAVLFSRRHRGLLAGCERSHSLTWDAHKMLFMPALCAFLLYRDRGSSYQAFQQAAPYLFDPSGPDLRDYDGGLRTVECTKRGAALGLWGVWSLFGPGLFEDLVDVTFALGRSLYEKLQAAEDFEALHEPECNIVVFRHIPPRLRGATPEEVGAFQLRVRRRAIESGETYLVPGSFGGVPALRCTLMNPMTTPDHLDELLETLRRHGRADASA
ncbi:MAG: pyridoxal phosphate-dependent decarboxylase family protein [Planctomycetaceae bacterium]